MTHECDLVDHFTTSACNVCVQTDVALSWELNFNVMNCRACGRGTGMTILPFHCEE